MPCKARKGCVGSGGGRAVPCLASKSSKFCYSVSAQGVWACEICNIKLHGALLCVSTVDVSVTF